MNFVILDFACVRGFLFSLIGGLIIDMIRYKMNVNCKNIKNIVYVETCNEPKAEIAVINNNNNKIVMKYNKLEVYTWIFAYLLMKVK